MKNVQMKDCLILLASMKDKEEDLRVQINRAMLNILLLFSMILVSYSLYIRSFLGKMKDDCPSYPILHSLSL